MGVAHGHGSEALSGLWSHRQVAMANGSSTTSGASGQEFCLKWNNHRTTIISVMDTLLEEESLVDVTLSADGQFLRAHRVILSACSPYFRQLFKSSFLNDKHPIIIMKDVDFDNLKSLVEYMYKGEANVPQQMLPSFIQTAESLQIRGLAEGASKQKLEQVAELNSISPHLNLPNIPVTPQTNVPPFPPKSESKKGGGDASILAARLKTMVDNPPMHMLDFQEQLALAARQAGHPLGVPPPMKENKKRRKMDQQQQPPSSQPNTSSPVKPDSNGHKEISVKKDLMSKNARLSPKISQNIMAPSVSSMVSNLSLTNNNDESDSDVLKIDEDGDRKETSEKDFEIAEVDNGYGGMDDSEEEITMDNNEKQMQRSGGVGFINPWTGEEMPGLAQVTHDVDNDEDSLQGGEGPFFPSLMDQTAISRSDITDEKPAMDTPNKYACGRCGRSYLHQATLVRHQRYECGISASYPCQLCGRKFKRRDVLKGHMEKCMNKSVASPINPSSASPMGSTSHLTMSIPSIPTISAISSLAMTSLPYGGP